MLPRSPSAEVLIRLALADEQPTIHAFVQAIADETFAYLVPLPVPLGEPSWQSAWVAVAEGHIAGVTMTQEDWVSDLWIARDHRRQGIGSLLLARAEREIASRGYRVFRLRVVESNTRAVDFYLSHGWNVHHEFPHEKFGHAMFEMNKSA
ncbi:MAG: GNAT family N-acetyltransferase [Acidobacteriaceae bacterium]